MTGLKFEVQLTISIVVSVLIFMPGCLTQVTEDSCNNYNDTSACCDAKCAFVTCLGTDNTTQVSKCINETTGGTVCLNFTDNDVYNCTTAPETCSDFNSNKTQCCDGPLNCTYVTNCTAQDGFQSDVCLADDDTAISAKCPKDHGQKTCTNPIATCDGLNKTECCASLLNCTFVANCTKEDTPINVCVQDDDDAIKIACPKDQGTKTCPKDQPSTTQSPTTTTTAPIKVKCNTLNESYCCGAKGQSLSCDYVNCTGTPACLNETERQKCNATADDRMCHMVSSTTTSSTTTTTAAASGRGSDCSKQHFDGASFIGGIILCGGIIAIIFFGLKFYRSRQDSNYHTL